MSGGYVVAIDTQEICEVVWIFGCYNLCGEVIGLFIIRILNNILFDFLSCSERLHIFLGLSGEFPIFSRNSIEIRRGRSIRRFLIAILDPIFLSGGRLRGVFSVPNN